MNRGRTNITISDEELGDDIIDAVPGSELWVGCITENPAMQLAQVRARHDFNGLNEEGTECIRCRGFMCNPDIMAAPCGHLYCQHCLALWSEAWAQKVPPETPYTCYNKECSKNLEAFLLQCYESLVLYCSLNTSHTIDPSIASWLGKHRKDTNGRANGSPPFESTVTAPALHQTENDVEMVITQEAEVGNDLKGSG